MANNDYVEIKIEWEPDTAPAQFANHLLVNYDGAVFTLRFFQVLPPTVLDPEKMHDVESVPGRHVATLVVAKDTLPSFSDVLKRMVDRLSIDEVAE
jgi:hypothetical protein